MSTGLPAPSRVDIRAMRERFALTQADIADMVHVDERTVRRWEAGKSSPSPMAIAHLRMMQRRMQAERQSEGANSAVDRESSAEPRNDGDERARAGQSMLMAGTMPRRRLPSL